MEIAVSIPVFFRNHLQKEITVKLIKLAALSLCLTLGSMSLNGCNRNGAAEKAGEKVDEATKKAGEAGEEATDTLKKALPDDTTNQ